jgi:hypothetical protein
VSDYLVMPDLEAVVRKRIADAGYRAYSSVPNTPTWPIAVVQRQGGSPAVRQYLDSARIQIDVWGGAKGDASNVPKSQIQDMMQDIRVQILRLEGTKVTTPVGAWITAVEDGGIVWMPDDSTGRDRYMLTVEVYGRSLLPGE